MSKICLVRQPAGIGDIFFTQKIAKHFIAQGYDVLWPVIEQFSFIKDYINDFYYAYYYSKCKIVMELLEEFILNKLNYLP